MWKWTCAHTECARFVITEDRPPEDWGYFFNSYAACPDHREEAEVAVRARYEHAKRRVEYLNEMGRQWDKKNPEPGLPGFPHCFLHYID